MSSIRTSIELRCLCVLFIVFAPIPTWGESATQPVESSSAKEIIARVCKSVVSIHVDAGDEAQRGAGFVVRDDGIIATNLQLVRNARAVRVRFSSGEELDAIGWVAYSVINNLALIQCPLPREPVSPLPLSKSTPPEKTQVFAISLPFGLEPIVSAGSVTGISKAAADSGDQPNLAADRILTNIPVSSASSGGPLVDEHGEVVGVTQESDKYAPNPNVAVSVEPLREPLGRHPLDPTPWVQPHLPKPDGPLDSAAAYVDRSDARWEQGEIDGAIADMTEAIRLAPQVADYYHHRAVAWMSKDDYDHAIADCNEALRLAPNNSEILFLRGTLWINTHDFDRAIADLSEVIRVDAKSALPYGLRGYAWLAKGEWDRAIADFDEAIRLDPAFHMAYFHRGLAWKNKGDKDRAKADFAQSNSLRNAQRESTSTKEQRP